MCLVLLDLENFPFFSNKITLLLSWYIMFYSTVYPWGSKQYLLKSACGTASSYPMSSFSVELLTFIFYFFEKLVTAPFPRVITAPVWLLRSSFIVQDASTHHFTTDRSSAVRVGFNPIVTLRYLKYLHNLNKSSSSGYFTLVVNKYTAVRVSLRDCAYRNISCDTV